MKYHIWTEGCQMNVADSQRLASALEALGYEAAEKPENADVVVLNTCMVRQSAEDRALGRLGSLKPAKKKNPNMIMGIMMIVAAAHMGPHSVPWKVMNDVTATGSV